MIKIAFTIEYAGLQLQVVKNEQGEDVTPLKPISSLFGLKWEKQRVKVTTGAYWPRFLGVCTIPMYGAGAKTGPKTGVCTPPGGGADTQNRDQTCILVSRVAGYLMSISPEQVRIQGNPDGADFLEQKQNEWADALHDYEEIGVAVNLNHARAQEGLRRQRAAFAQMIGVKNKTAAPADRKALGHVVKQMAGELGIAYQADLVDGE